MVLEDLRNAGLEVHDGVLEVHGVVLEVHDGVLEVHGVVSEDSAVEL